MRSVPFSTARVAQGFLVGLVVAFGLTVAAQQAQPASPSQAPPPIPEKTVTLPGHVGSALGKLGAPVTLVEFTDLECPNCREFDRDVFGKLEENYIDTGKLLFIHRDLPLPNHDHAVVAAHALRCAGDQGAFWPMRHMLLTTSVLSAGVVELAARLNDLDLARFRQCMRDGKYLGAIQKDIDDAHAIGAVVTPTFVLGRFVPQGIEGTRISGTISFEELDARIKAFLAADTSSQASTPQHKHTASPMSSGGMPDER